MNKAIQAPSILEHIQQSLRTDLERLIPESDTPAGLEKAIAFALDGSGKMVRPSLVLLAAQCITGSDSPQVQKLAAIPALALELIHTYSLIHDDLPAMDDDDIRRGRPSLHKAFDEATAVLVGDGLQARAFALITEAPELRAEQKVLMINTLARASGFAGMVGGQYIDIQATDSDMSLEALRAMHEMKTGALIRASLALGGMAANAGTQELSALDDYGRHIGLAFQVVDDILDVEGDSATLGKTSGKDMEANKPTYVKLLGLEGAKEEAGRLLGLALAALEGFGEPADGLRELASYIVERNR